MASGRQDSLIRGVGAAAIVAAPTIPIQVTVPPPTIHTGVTVQAPRIAAAVTVHPAGAGDPTPFGVNAVFGANSSYDNPTNHPGIPAMSIRDSTDYYDDALAAAISRSGRILAGPHTYSGSSWPSTFAASSCSWAATDGWSFAFLNVKSGAVSSWPSLRDGTGQFTDAFINAFIDSVPSNVVLVFTVNHEPENDGTQPSGDGGVWETANAPIWGQGVARVANLVAARNRPNVYFAVVLMKVTFPANGSLGGTGSNGRVPSRWNCWQYMTAAAKARTIFAPDGYTEITTSTGVVQTGSTVSAVKISSAEAGGFSVGDKILCETTGGVLLFGSGGDGNQVFSITSKTGTNPVTLGLSPSLPSVLSPGNHQIRKFESIGSQAGFFGAYEYIQAAGWGVERRGVFEHTVNNDVNVSGAHVAAIIRQDIKPWLRQQRDAGGFACYVHFNHSDPAGASGTRGWWETPEESLEAGRLAWELNTGEVL